MTASLSMPFLGFLMMSLQNLQEVLEVTLMSLRIRHTVCHTHTHRQGVEGVAEGIFSQRDNINLIGRTTVHWLWGQVPCLKEVADGDHTGRYVGRLNVVGNKHSDEEASMLY